MRSSALSFAACNPSFLLTNFLSLLTLTFAGACQPGQYVCANGQCIERSQRCDGTFDCSDYSDESDCGMLLNCIYI